VPRWKPTETWKDRDVFVIGGGPSLRGFKWDLLKDECTVGCNTAYTLGPQVCKICFFGDSRWFRYEGTEAGLERYASEGGTVFTSAPSLMGSRTPWLWVIQREARGLSTVKDATLGWNGNSGASAINLALILGAKCVYLLGFDMGLSKEKKSNWHDKIMDHRLVRPQVYDTFQNEFRFVVRDWKKKFADRQIVNVTRSSGLPSTMFPWVDPDAFWADRGMQRMGFQKSEVA
jgi:hypothetical protein